MLFVVKVKGLEPEMISVIHEEIKRVNRDADKILAESTEVQSLLQKVRALGESRIEAKKQAWLASCSPGMFERHTCERHDATSCYMAKAKSELEELRAGKFDREVDVKLQERNSSDVIAIERSSLMKGDGTYELVLVLQQPTVQIYANFLARMPGENGIGYSVFDPKEPLERQSYSRRWFLINPMVLYGRLYEMMGLTRAWPIEAKAGLTTLTGPTHNAE